jgi:hypothetical protein
MVSEIQYRSEGEVEPLQNATRYHVRLQYTNTLSVAQLIEYVTSTNLNAPIIGLAFFADKRTSGNSPAVSIQPGFTVYTEPLRYISLAQCHHRSRAHLNKLKVVYKQNKSASMRLRTRNMVEFK